MRHTFNAKTMKIAKETATQLRYLFHRKVMRRHSIIQRIEYPMTRSGQETNTIKRTYSNITTYVDRFLQPNDQAQRRGRNAKENSSRLFRVRCSAFLDGALPLANLAFMMPPPA
jgi:hypothetical protein